ncbi:lipoprotein releasing system, ATP-binding protein [Candidatus Endobugula sertula]|uniref:Lipoprotein-releasing system ATP-binding protein LolD n=1 Tax=Candidatus Endobugula sertula TaxID=62101 RepID=A0A1D2QSP9_9GAMM|nr:lipoprotein releasing system, ATP-binding protein [Candidatus Endobugula sertula]
MNDVIIQCRGLTKNYHEGPQDICVLDGVELELKRGERLAIIGSSGVGKSTLLNLLGGLDTPTSGDVSVVGELLSGLDDDRRGALRNQKLGFVYQFHHLLGEFTAEENVSMPLLIGGLNKHMATQRSVAILNKVGLANRLYHKPAELSGGERQRVAIARAIVTEPACVLMDEPTGNLDEETANTIESLLITLNQQMGLSFIIVTHNKRLAASMDRVLELKEGRLFPAVLEATR